jgi:hypothetical protein
MNEIEMKQAYNECVTLINNAPYQESQEIRDLHKAMNNVLLMLWQLHEDIQEMQSWRDP